METVDSMIKATRHFVTKNHINHYIATLRVKDVEKEMEDVEKYIEQEAPDCVDELDFWELMRTKIAMDMLGL